MENKKLRIGFIGNGKSANRYHVPFILSRPEKLELKKMYTIDHSKDIWEEIPGVTYTEDLNDLLADPEIDVVIISTPSAFHYENAKACILAGKNCVVEKPFCQTADQARELFALAKEKGVMVQGYQNRRFDSDYLTTKAVIESGKLGELLEVEVTYDYYRPEIPENRYWNNPINSYLYGHATHLVDQIIALFGKPDHYHLDVRQLLGEGRMNDYFDLDFYYTNPLKVSAKSSYFRIKDRPKYTVYGKKGMWVKTTQDKQEEHLKMFYMPLGHDDFGADKPENYGTLTYYDDQGVYHEEKVPTIKGDYARYYDALYETIINGADKLVKEEETIAQIEILEQGIKQCR